jgi:hypothetical protein
MVRGKMEKKAPPLNKEIKKNNKQIKVGEVRENQLKKTKLQKTNSKSLENKNSKGKAVIKKNIASQNIKQDINEETNFNRKEKIKQALIKKALGFMHNEVVEEYVFDEDGEVKLSKRKVTKKFSPPDIPAAKILLEEFEDKQDLSQMTVEELEKEKSRLLKQLKEV